MTTRHTSSSVPRRPTESRTTVGRQAFQALTGLLVAAASSLLLMIAVAAVTVLALNRLDTDGHWWILPVVVILPAYVVGRGVASAAIATQPTQSGYLGVFFGMAAGVVMPPAVMIAGPMPLAQIIVGDDDAARRRVPVDLSVTAPADIDPAVMSLLGGWMFMLFLGVLHAGLIELRRRERADLSSSRRF